MRLERGQGEFWLLGLMLAGLKTHAGGLFARPLGPQRHMRGFFSDSLLRTLELLPEHLWPKSRRKRDYVSGVLARAEVGSAYRPARKLWKRRETSYYAPAPDLKLRRKTADGETWTSIAEAMNGGRRRRVVLRRLWPRRGRCDGVPSGGNRIGVVLTQTRRSERDHGLSRERRGAGKGCRNGELRLDPRYAARRSAHRRNVPR